MKGSELKKWRKEAGLSRDQVAAHLGVSPRTIEAWEQERTEITERGQAQLKALVGKLDILAVPMSAKLKKGIREKAKAKGVDPGVWAAEILEKIVE